jgi:predicted DNA-binding protein (MmcQ/YjbR family)
MARRDPLATASLSLRDYGLTYPQSVEESPWGERAIKVKGKVFVFLSLHKGKFYVTVKLPVSGFAALQLPFAEPTGYGLGKHGWVTATFTAGDLIPLDLLREWIDESYRAVAPKSVLSKFEELETDGQKALKTKSKKRGK